MAVEETVQYQYNFYSTLEKKLFAVATFAGLGVISFQI